MTADEIEDAVLAERVPAHEGFQVENPWNQDDILFVDGYAALPVATISSGVCRDTDVEIVDPNRNPLGTLCFTKNLGNVARADLTLWQFIAFLADAEDSEIDEPHYSFKSDYVIIEPGRYDDYLKDYYHSAPIWGRFSHELIKGLEHPTGTSMLTAIPGIGIASQHHREVFNRYLYANNPMERFLRIYHSLELLFDYTLVRKIKKINDDLIGFSQIYNNFGRTELDRLRAIIREFCANPAAVATALQASSRFQQDRQDIFHIHTKQGDPAADAEKWEKLTECVDSGTLNAIDLASKGLVNRNVDFQTFIANVSSYWIYRIRCSIAHNRVGEFLLQDRHNAFVAEFAEPLILEVAKQIFANEDFKAL
ncbi:hypothetical protein ACQKO5_04380 [Novosphingobium subterraneum]|uniref:hypothetical protein n=1 Tax=Novosphingobium subterraneum TaxID=48936 RepID=UPI003D03F2C5